MIGVAVDVAEGVVGRPGHLGDVGHRQRRPEHAEEHQQHGAGGQDGDPTGHDGRAYVAYLARRRPPRAPSNGRCAADRHRRGRSRVYRGRMSDVPFGFGLPDRDPERRERGKAGEPAAATRSASAPCSAASAGGGSPEDLLGKMPLFAELQKLMNWSGGPVNWDLARQGAISQLAAGHQPTSQAEQTAVAEALRLADLWLDQVTELPSGIERDRGVVAGRVGGEDPAGLAALIDPLAEKVVAAMTSALPAGGGDVVRPDRRDHGPDGRPDVRRPGRPGPRQARRRGRHQHRRRPPARARRHRRARAAERGRLRAPAWTAPPTRCGSSSRCARPPHQRLFAHVPWLRQQLQDAVHAYARGITIDREAIERGLDRGHVRHGGRPRPEQPGEHPAAAGQRRARAGGDPRAADGAAPAGDAARARRGLGGHASSPRPPRTGCPGTPALAETMRRRRATGGPAEQTFATLVGLELRPRRLRDAATVWGAMGQRYGSAERDRLWSHPDLLPTSDDLDEPLDFVARQDMDDELAATHRRRRRPTPTAGDGPRPDDRGRPPRRERRARQSTAPGSSRRGRRPRPASPRGGLLDALEEARAPARPAGSARPAPRSASSCPGSSRCTSSCTRT